MFRRRRAADTASAEPIPAGPVPAWRARVDELGVLLAAAPGPAAASVADVVAALEAAEQDHGRLMAALVTLDPDRATQELKAALREAGDRPSPEQEARIATLRRRHDSVQALANRRDVLRETIDRTVVDLEALAASAVASSMTTGDDGRALAAELERVRIDILALEAARAELDGL